MRNFILIFGLMVSASLAKAQETMIINWLPAVDTVATTYGNPNNPTTLAPFMEFYVDDLLNYNSTGKSIVGINQIHFYLGDAAVTNSIISDCKVVIMQGADITTATVKYTQNVSWAKGWNVINLTSEYVVDANQRLYIGYEVTTSKGGYPVALANGTEPKQAWMKGASGTFSNLINDAGYKYVCLIKANAIVEDSPDDEIALTSLNLSRIQMKGDSITVKGTVKNLGKLPITSFDIYYEVNGVRSSTYSCGTTVASGGSYSFTHPEKYGFADAEFCNIVVTVAEPNGVVDITGNNTQEAGVLVFAQKLPRVVLHEVFTSSTCPPCKPGNEQLDKVLKAQDVNKWACVKYQYYFPGNGDPYFTDEAYTRGNFYGGVGSVPSLFGDGTYNVNPNSYSATNFNSLVNVSAAAAMTGTATLNSKTVSLNVTINPTLTYDNPNLRFFAAIIEKETFNNRYTTPNQSNGETVFYYVMKKFMTSEYGNAIDPLELNKPIALNYSYTFNGNYRLPANAYSTLINHATENSVEDFSALMVVYWLQDVVTKEVYQAGKADPNPSYQSRVSVKDIALTPNRLLVYPNPAKDNVSILTADPIKEVTIHNLLGQKVGTYTGNITTIPVSDLSKGIYVITVKTENNVFNQKFIKE